MFSQKQNRIRQSKNNLASTKTEAYKTTKKLWKLYIYATQFLHFTSVSFAAVCFV